MVDVLRASYTTASKLNYVYADDIHVGSTTRKSTAFTR